jgi:F-box/TPR repeat protein Pof3
MQRLEELPGASYSALEVTMLIWVQIKRPRLWQNLDLSGATKPVSRVFIRHAIQYGENAVNSLTVHRFQHTDVLRNIATACKSLHSLEILSLPLMLSDTLVEVAQCAINLKKLVIHTDISTDTLEYIAFTSILKPVFTQCKGPFPNLHTLQVTAKPKVIQGSFGFVESLLRQAPVLQSLSIVSWDSMVSLLTVYRSCSCVPVLSLNPSLLLISALSTSLR